MLAIVRLWSLHPKYLDAKGLVALWREGLLAQAVLLGKTKGYKNHPQLERFRESSDPEGAIADYLGLVLDESIRRGYHFSADKIGPVTSLLCIPVTTGQLEYEFAHLQKKLLSRDPIKHASNQAETGMGLIDPHPLFHEFAGSVEHWEKV